MAVQIFFYVFGREVLFCNTSAVWSWCARQVFRFFIVARGRVTRPDPVPQLITASQTQQITGDSELTVDSPHTRALGVDLGQIHEHKHADRRNSTHLLALKPYQSA